MILSPLCSPLVELTDKTTGVAFVAPVTSIERILAVTPGILKVDVPAPQVPPPMLSVLGSSTLAERSRN